MNDRVGTSLFDRAKGALGAAGTCHLTWYFFEVANAALWLPGNAQSVEERLALVLDGSRSKILEFQYLRSISGDDFARSANEAVLRNVAGVANDAELLERLGRFNALFRDVGEGDRYELAWQVGKGGDGWGKDGGKGRSDCDSGGSGGGGGGCEGAASLAYNGTVLGEVRGDARFGHAIFTIWFGSQPFMEQLKTDLLSGVEGVVHDDREGENKM